MLTIINGQDQILWATLAAISSKKNQLEIAEEAYSATLQIDKVKYLQYIKVIYAITFGFGENFNIQLICDSTKKNISQTLPPGSYEQMAEMSVMMGRCNEAETILLHNGKFREAIELCVRMHRWERV